MDDLGYSIFKLNGNIIQIVFKAGFYCELNDAVELIEKIKELSDGEKLCLLVIYADDNLFSKETRAFIAKHKYTKADALVGSSLAIKIAGNFYLKMNKPVRPTKLFNDVESAVEWLNGIV
jgi:hypothetical protein